MTDKEKEFSAILKNLAESLDIPDTYYEKAVGRYHRIGEWLERSESIVADKKPNIYPQGSFLLGTMVKPINDEDEYDIDLVCELEGFSKQDLSQKELKIIVGTEVKSYAKRNDIDSPVKEGKRCWTLEYADEAGFHMDILPSIPDDDESKAKLVLYRVSNSCVETAISITDINHKNYNRIDNDWYSSNPKGYAAWFKERMRRQFEIQRKIYADSIIAKVEEVPEYKVKTTLQRAIQLLKRHRDIMFADDQDDKPISIIITTLAAHSYNNEEDLLEALNNIVKRMPQYKETRDDISWVPNPVNPSENFADKWKDNPQREKKFLQWLVKLNEDIEIAFNQLGIDSISKKLELCFGEKATERAISKIGENYARTRNSGALKMSSVTGVLGSTGEKDVKKHTFYGE